jgi:two-component system sensor histidine kinase ResE
LENNKNIKLVAQYEQMPDIKVEIDVDRIEQVLTNLIDNAIRHSEVNGEIKIVARMKSDDNFIIEVSDVGEGMKEEDIPFVFERFFKSDRARTRVNPGMGLGLSIVKNIITNHHGSISVRSNKPHGTVFTIILPVKQ